MKRFALAILVVAAVAASAIAVLNRPGAQASPGVTITVNSTADSGPGTLRQALLDAQSGDSITFDPTVFSPTSPATIALSSILPTLTTGNVTVDGSSAGVIVDGMNIGFDCLPITSDNNTIKGLEIYNCYDAVVIFSGAQNNTIGGSWPSERNVISGGVDGVIVWGSGTAGNVVKGNYIGTNASGTAAAPNSHEGVVIVGNAQNNRVESNVISGNSGYGVAISGSGTNGNVVKGNYIGIDPYSIALPNGQDGVHIVDGAKNSTVENNVISGNTGGGVHIQGAGTDGNVLKGNKIGTNAAGDAALSNGGNGVYISEGAQNNTVEDNVISGNSTGVEIRGSGTDGNFVVGNHIGVDADGTAAISNTFAGVQIWEDARNNIVGGSNPGQGNILSGNGFEGVQIRENAAGNSVIGNYVGIDASGSVPIPNGFQGVQIRGGAQNNTVGGSNPGQGNTISGNGFEGVEIRGGATGNLVMGNYIGTDASSTVAVPNGDTGVEIRGGARYNTVGGTGVGEGNTIAFNAADGVQVRGTDTWSNTIRGNSIHSNDGEGIALSDGGNNELTAPTITGFGSVEGTACPNCAIDIHSDQDDEGEVYEGSTTADGDGDWSFEGSPEGPNVTVTATDSDGNTSEFSHPAEVPEVTPTPTPTPSATATATPTPPASATRTLVWDPGWHNETWTGASTPEEAFACAAGNFAAAYRYVNGGFQRYFPDRLDISNMSDLDQYDTFFILITDDVSCDMTVSDPLGAERTLDWGVGWHNEGWTGPDGTDPEDAFACAAGSYAAAYRYVDGGLERYFPDRPDISNMGSLNQYDPFLILVTAPVSCSMSIAP